MSLLSAVSVLFITALVSVGIGALFMSIPPRYQPGMTQRWIDLSTAYLRHGPHPRNITSAVLIAFSSAAVLLACAPLYDALRISGPRRLAQVLLAPLVLFALLNLTYATSYWFAPPRVPWANVGDYELYFQPNVIARELLRLSDGGEWSRLPVAFFIEVAKWSTMLTIALWLTLARFAAGRSRKSAGAAAARRDRPVPDA